MRATIVGKLEQKFNDRFSQIERKTIVNNSFEETAAVAGWLEQLFAEKIGGKKSFRNFENAITGTLKATLQKGDEYYFELFRKEKIINKKTADKQLNNPFTSVVQAIYNGLFKNNHSYNEDLTIYRELRLHIEKQIGALIAVDSSLQSFKCWLNISQNLEVEHDIYRAWIRNIPLDNIIAEKDKFSVIKKADLNELAYIRGYGRNNKAEAKNYIAHLKKLSTKPIFDYITEVTRGSDLLTLKAVPELQQTLVRRLNVGDWLLFIDSLHFPNLQDHAFLSVNILSDYTEIIGDLLKNKKLKTPKAHLFLITLENYYDFIDRTTTDLLSLSQRSHYDEKSKEIKQLKKEVSNEYDLWFKEYIPDSFNRILSEIFPEGVLNQSEFFLLLFEWINSHGKLHLVHRGNESKKSLIDLLNDLFLKRLGTNQSDRHFLIENLQKSQVNYEALRKLVSIYEENKGDLYFRDRLYCIYLDFISAESFTWHASENVDFEEAINNAYYFSQILCSYDDSYIKWDSLFAIHKTAHEGWHFTYADYKIYQREAFLLTAGVGMAYLKYLHVKGEAEIVFYKVIGKLVNQHRNAGESRSVDYVSPLKFAAVTVGRYSPGNCEDFLKLVSAKFDDLKYILIVLAELKEYNKNLSLSEEFKRQISKRIADEFWIIENRKSDLLLRQSLDYYKSLKENAMEFCKII